MLTAEYTFDCAWDCPLGDFLELIEKHKLTLKSFIANGPGGGNPEITVTGDLNNINLFSRKINE
jgi:hypothetical protein